MNRQLADRFDPELQATLPITIIGTDGSYHLRHTGWGIVKLDGTDLTFDFGSGPSQIAAVETFALERVIRDFGKAKTKKPVRVHSDSRVALAAARTLMRTEACRSDAIAWAADKASEGLLSLHWVKGHGLDLANILADHVARTANVDLRQRVPRGVIRAQLTDSLESLLNNLGDGDRDGLITRYHQSITKKGTAS